MSSASAPRSRRSSHAGLNVPNNGRFSRQSSSNSLSTMADEPQKRPVSRNHSAPLDTCRYSQRSVLTALDRFVKSVNNMDSVVLVPSKLSDISVVGQKSDASPPGFISGSDLYGFYKMLKEEKNELLWGPDTERLTAAIQSSAAEVQQKQHKVVFRLSSAGSTSNSSSDEEESDAEKDAIVTTTVENVKNPIVAASLRQHLQGLKSILHQLADVADYLTVRYKEEIDG